MTEDRSSRHGSWHRRLAATSLLLAGGALGCLLTLWWIHRNPVPPPPREAFVVVLPETHDMIETTLAPDGQTLVYAAATDGVVRLYARSFGSFEVRPLDGTEHATQPFFAPDGSRIGFFADGSLRWVAMEGGPVVDVVRVGSHTAGAAWGPDDRIVYAALDGAGLRRVAAAPGDPTDGEPSIEMLTVPDREQGEVSHGWPHVLPDGGGIVFTVGREDRDPRLAWLAPDADEPTLLAPADGGAFFVESGHLVYARRDEAFAVEIDLETNEVGPIRPLVDGVASSAAGYGRLGRSSLVAATTGRLVYAPPSPRPARNRLVWVERTGAWRDVDGVEALHGSPRLTMDGARVATTIRSGPFRRDLWIHELGEGTRRQLTSEAGDNHSPVWSTDGRRLAFASNREGPQQIYRITIDDVPPSAERWIDGDARTPGSWAPDTGTLLFHEAFPERGRDIWQWTDDASDGNAAVLIGTPANERTPALSGDGRWLAYVSDAVDGDQVYVRRHPDGPEWRVSPSGGTEPVWSKDGRELFFRRGLEIFVVPIGATEPGTGQRLFEGAFARDPSGNVPSYDVDRDGSRLLMIRAAARTSALSVLTGWEP